MNIQKPLKYFDTVTRTGLLFPAQNKKKDQQRCPELEKAPDFQDMTVLCGVLTGYPTATEEVRMINGSGVSLLETCFTQANQSGYEGNIMRAKIKIVPW